MVLLIEKWHFATRNVAFSKRSGSLIEGPLSQREPFKQQNEFSKRSLSFSMRSGSFSKGSARLDYLRSEGVLAIGEAQPRAIAFNVNRGRLGNWRSADGFARALLHCEKRGGALCQREVGLSQRTIATSPP